MVFALHPIPNQGAHTREDLFSMALSARLPEAMAWKCVRASSLGAAKALPAARVRAVAAKAKVLIMAGSGEGRVSIGRWVGGG